MKVIRKLLLGVITVFLLTGCWNRIEVNDIAIVTAIGLDLVEENMIRLTLQVAIPTKLGPAGASSGGGKDRSTFVISEKGVTVSEAYRKLQMKLSRRVFFSQSRVLLISESLARKGIFNIIDFYTRFHQPRMNSFIMFTEGAASEVIKNMPNLESVSAEETKELAKLSVGLKVYVRDFLNMLLTDGLEPYAPQYKLTSVEVDTENESGKIQSINGAAVFKKDKLIGWMDETETRGILWLRNEIEGGVITIKVPKEKGGGNISLDIIGSKTKILPHHDHGQMKITVNVTSEMSAIENTSKLVLFNPKVIEEIQKNIEKEIKGRIQLVVNKAQKDFQSDIFGFGQAVYREYPKAWNTFYKKNWNHEFSQVEVNIKSKVYVRRIGLSK
ncbi:Ger(x)C family spore germination protein [Neobacillus sp. MER 74]|uniref:Ger(x)C family spore germination protein n=1 Tax=Neobacillus sp. MER 74 TaxID=2939566 RepID=UPI002040A9CA|nr:Ger(x)C family spore germination protein [Neobacillus sp. MER 74]MCM3116682.1 Ger(x)C family spore germination protein [Neobacillus sp. MER 74]